MKNLIYLIFLLLIILSGCNNKSDIEYFKSGNSKYKIKDYNGAIKDFSKAIKINPKYSEAFYMRGKTYLENNREDDHENSYNDLSEAIRINPEFIDAYITRAELKLKKGSNIDAFEDYNKIIQINPNDDECYCLRAELKVDLEDLRSAIEDYKKAIKINPKKIKYYSEVASIYGILNNTTEQIIYYEKALNVDPTISYFLGRIADTKAGIKDHKGAIKYYTKYLENKFFDNRFDKKTDILIARGKAKILAGLDVSGLEDFSKAGELGNEKAYTAIAEYKGEKGRIKFEREKADPNNKVGLTKLDHYMGQDTENWLGKH